MPINPPFGILDRTQIEDAREIGAGRIERADLGAGGEDQFFERQLFARTNMDALCGGRNADDFGFKAQVDAVRAVKIVRNNTDAFFSVAACEKALGKGRAFVRRRVLSRYDGQVAGFKSEFGQLFSGVTGDHAAA